MTDFNEHLTDTLETALGRLRRAIDDAGECCDLKSITFAGGRVPDYSLPAVQDLYSLRYYGAYLCEYRTIYEEPLKFLEAPIVVQSLGCGSGVDLAALYFEARERDLPLDDVRWKGYDRIKWTHRATFSNLTAKYVEGCVSAIDHLSRETNLIIFPKSISEFDEGTFKVLLATLKGSTFERDRLVLTSSARATDYALHLDTGRFERVAEVFLKHHGYKSNDAANKFWSFKRPETAWAVLYHGFQIPDEVVEFLKVLAEHCPTRIEKGEPCEVDCDKTLSRWPMLKAKAARYQIMRFAR